MDSIAALIDKLCVTNQRIWTAEDIKRDKDASDEKIVQATKLTNVANAMRNDLIQEIDERLNHMVKTGELQKLYQQGSTKLYGKDKK